MVEEIMEAMERSGLFDRNGAHILRTGMGSEESTPYKLGLRKTSRLSTML
jgi:hypothetical protein